LWVLTKQLVMARGSLLLLRNTTGNFP